VVKPTGWATNSGRIANRLDARCENRERPAWSQHRHCHLTDGRAKAYEVYPPKLVKEILLGLKEELEDAGEWH
jgi:hypothetical protein